MCRGYFGYFLINKAVFTKFFAFKKLNTGEWIGAEGTRLRREVAVDLRPLKRCEETQAPPRGKRVTAVKSSGKNNQ